MTFNMTLFTYNPLYLLISLITHFKVFESTLAKQRIANLQQLRQMRREPHVIAVYRAGKWTRIKTDE